MGTIIKSVAFENFYNIMEVMKLMNTNLRLV